MAEALLEVVGVTKRFGGFTALDGVDFMVRPGERVGLIGPNGSGKSTLVNCIAGTLRNEEGSIRFEGQDIGRHPAHKRIRLELARAMAAKPKLLISDEAMAGLSASEVDDILALLFGLKERGVAVIMIEQVMRAVMKFSERIAVLVAGRKIADGDPQAVAGNAEVVKAYLGE